MEAQVVTIAMKQSCVNKHRFNIGRSHSLGFSEAVPLKVDNAFSSEFSKYEPNALKKKSKFKVPNELLWHIVEFFSASFNLSEMYERREKN